MYVSGPGTYWLGQKVKRQGHSRKPREHHISQSNERNFTQFWSQMYFVFVDVLISCCDQRSRSSQAMAWKTGWIPYLRKYFHQNWVIYAPVPEIYWLGQKVKGKRSKVKVTAVGDIIVDGSQSSSIYTVSQKKTPPTFLAVTWTNIFWFQ